MAKPETALTSWSPEGDLPARVGGLRRRLLALRAVLARQAVAPASPFAVAERMSAGERWRTSMSGTDRLWLLEEVVRHAKVAGCTIIAVVSPKGGVGKTTLGSLLGSLLAELRRDPVTALDCNADFGNLADRFCQPGRRGLDVDELWAWAHEEEVSPAALTGRLGQAPHGLRVIGIPNTAERMLAAADHGLYEGLLGWLRGFGGVILADCGTGLLDPPTRAALEAADQIVLVTDAAADTARLVVEAGRQLPAGRPLWLVANKHQHRCQVDLTAVAAALPNLRHAVTLPAVDRAENIVTPTFRWEAAPPPWQEPVRELAASLARSWGDSRPRADTGSDVWATPSPGLIPTPAGSGVSLPADGAGPSEDAPVADPWEQDRPWVGDHPSSSLRPSVTD